MWTFVDAHMARKFSSDRCSKFCKDLFYVALACSTAVSLSYICLEDNDNARSKGGIAVVGWMYVTDWTISKGPWIVFN